MLTKALAILVLLLAITAGGLALLAHDRGLKLDTAAVTHKTDTDKIAELAQSGRINNQTITDLLGRLNHAAGVARDVQAAADAAQALAATNADARDKALAEARRLKGELYAHDQASAVWATGHLSDALTDRVRRSWLDAAGRGADDARAGCTGGAVCGDSGQPAGAPRIGTAALARVPCTDGCYTNDQLLEMLDAALDSRGRCIDQLDAIGRLSIVAVKASSKP